MIQTEAPPWIRPCIVLHFGEHICVASDALCATVIQRQIPFQISKLFVIWVCLVSNHLTKHHQSIFIVCLSTLVHVSVNHLTFQSPGIHTSFRAEILGSPPYTIYHMEFTSLKVNLWFQDAQFCNSLYLFTSSTNFNAQFSLFIQKIVH